MREAPGYLDLQINGAFGYDFTTDPSSIWKVGERLVEHGVTAFLPTVISSAPGTVEQALATLAQGPPPDYQGARALGVHAEGPMLAPERRGTHPADRLVSASIEVVSEWGRGLTIVTIAPELPGAREVIESLVDRGVRVSIGHTAATYDQALAAVDWGATLVTHLFNAMPALEHRAPGPIGVALSDGRLRAGLIVDGIHSHPGTVAAAWSSLGPDRLFLVSDAIAAAGMPLGQYSIGDVEVTVTDERVLNREGRLAGSTLFLDQAVRNLVGFTGCKTDEAIAAATTVPAGAIGAEPIGEILLDDDLFVVRTTIDGKEVWER